MMLQTGLSVATQAGVLPVCAVRLLTGSVVLSLCKLGKEKDARDLLVNYEQLYVFLALCCE